MCVCVAKREGDRSPSRPPLDATGIGLSLSDRQSRPSGDHDVAMQKIANINDVLAGHVALDLDCVDRLLLNAYVQPSDLWSSGDVHERSPGQPIRSPVVMNEIGNRSAVR